jgi:ABC-type glycerol-3-phosphate transport system substrate-binding protein
MTELWLTVYGGLASLLEEPSFLLDEFQKKSRVNVRVSHMAFEDAWPKLLEFALHGGGPQVSLIGGIWTSTITSMNVLRPFSAKEISSLGGESVFYPAVWKNAVTTGAGVWSIPFYMFTYLVLYRKDYLAQAGIDETSAFSNALAMEDTVKRLKAAGIPSPLILPSGQSFRARTHLLASWIWAHGGRFISEDEAHACFADPEAIRGMVEFFNLYRYMNPKDYGLSAPQSLEQFATGKTAITFAGANSQESIVNINQPEVMENIGVAPVPGVPWFGGSNLVIWKEVRMNPELERAAIDLIRFLTEPAAQIKLANAQYSLPSRVEALPEINYGIPVYRAAVEESVRRGQSYPPVRLWVRIMNDLTNVFDLITADVIEHPDEDIEQILLRRLKPLANRLNLMMS